ncbi:hypothetical protein ACQ4LE_007335 [Meloidogyne hapla]|uniref:Uncharacterized protein n=1 Tax=Meloidogyne hapla TaxID=6305 RepID=A0A1I8BVQ0_MELHA
MKFSKLKFYHLLPILFTLTTQFQNAASMWKNCFGIKTSKDSSLGLETTPAASSREEISEQLREVRLLHGNIGTNGQNSNNSLNALWTSRAVSTQSSPAVSTRSSPVHHNSVNSLRMQESTDTPLKYTDLPFGDNPPEENPPQRENESDFGSTTAGSSVSPSPNHENAYVGEQTFNGQTFQPFEQSSALIRAGYHQNKRNTKGPRDTRPRQ